jgi:hypothetical protein
MFDLTDVVGKTITLRSVAGDEFIAKLLGTNTDTDTITLGEPRVVVINNNNDVSLLPFVLTASTEMVDVSLNTIFSVMETHEVTAKEYSNSVAITPASTSVIEPEMETEE